MKVNNMKINNIYKIITVDELSATPKYMQLANSIIKGIDEGNLEKDEMLPSINELSYEFDIARDTAERAYKHLKKLGILGSVPGKGYFILNTDIKKQLKIFLLFNKLSFHKKLIYDSFVESLGNDVSIDFYIYNNDFLLFKKLLTQRKEDYNYLVIIPHFVEGGEKAYDIINSLPKDKLILLDKKIPNITEEFGSVYENFEKDIFGALEKAKPQLSKYHTIKILFPEYSYYPLEILKGFKHFCQEYAFHSKVVYDINVEPLKKGEVYINLMEADLVTLIEKIISSKLKIGKDIGVISYNDTPLKKIILSGITTISTDFQMMGKLTAKLILEKSKAQIEVPFYLTLRSSL